ncbi:Cyclopentanone 12-monooxygenase [Fusarium albosuccineum]|uniref:Cyclopentanone 12-monooxygenase n=1 Tax=Fusarium albosuccineum TaxID=1237068 RepID=A0A8H4P749_9HYPO|nr:Cyclopentanone 12-monooxygenase [Fusarium albosuccineum]
MASDYGGVWYWNRYPGARVDSAVPHYEFSDSGLWREWTWKQRFPGSAEIRDYFSYVADKWGLRKDTHFNTHISKAVWDEQTKRWAIESKDGKRYVARYFLLNTGFAAKRHVPE